MTNPTTTVFGITYNEAAIIDDDFNNGRLPNLQTIDPVRWEASGCYAHGHWPDHNITTDSDLAAHWDGWYESHY